MLFVIRSFGQADSPLHNKPDTAHAAKKNPVADTGSRAISGNRLVDSAGRGKGAIDSLQLDSLKAASSKLKSTSKNTLRWDNDTAFARLLTFSLTGPGVITNIHDGPLRPRAGKDELFYILAGLVLFAALVKVSYPKYFQNVFRQFFQTSLRQKQTPEQIVQGYVPGFLLNLLFCMVGGMCIALYAMQHPQQKLLDGPLWLTITFSAAVLACVYLLKYLVTFFTGWVFNVKEAAGTYSFIVFLVNRIIGIILLPVLILQAFYNGPVQTVMFTIAGCTVVLLLIYRYALSLTVIGKNLKVSALHFFIYLCAVELMPLLVIYKVLFR